MCSPSVEITDDYVALRNLTFSVTIPPTVGPSGQHYVLIAQIFRTDGSWYGSKFDSEVFELTGANGTWSDYQSSGFTLWGTEALPCSSFACVNGCGDETFKYQPNWPLVKNETYQSCANACPSVSIDFDSSTQGGLPTGSLTTPSSCSVSQTASATGAIKTTDSGSIPSATRSQGAITATETSDALPRHQSGNSCLLGVLALAVMLVIG